MTIHTVTVTKKETMSFLVDAPDLKAASKAADLAADELEWQFDETDIETTEGITLPYDAAGDPFTHVFTPDDDYGEWIDLPADSGVGDPTPPTMDAKSVAGEPTP